MFKKNPKYFSEKSENIFKEKISFHAGLKVLLSPQYEGN